MKNSNKTKLVKKKNEKKYNVKFNYLLIAALTIIFIGGVIVTIWYAFFLIRPITIENGIKSNINTVYLNVGKEQTDTNKDVYIEHMDIYSGYVMSSIVDPSEKDKQVKNDLKLKQYNDHINVSVTPYEYDMENQPIKRIHQSEHLVEILLKSEEKIYTTYIRVHINEISLSLKDQTVANSLALLPGENEKTFKYTNFDTYKSLGYNINKIEYEKDNNIFSVEKADEISFKIKKISIGEGNFDVRVNSNSQAIFAERSYKITTEISKEIELEKSVVNISDGQVQAEDKINNFLQLKNDGYKFDEAKTNKNNNLISLKDDKLIINSSLKTNRDYKIYFKTEKFNQSLELSTNLTIIQKSVKNIVVDNNTDDIKKDIELGTTLSLKINNYDDLVGGTFEIEYPNNKYINYGKINNKSIEINSNLLGDNEIRILYKKPNNETLTSAYIKIHNKVCKDETKLLNQLKDSLNFYNKEDNFNNYLVVADCGDKTMFASLADLFIVKYFNNIVWKNKDTSLNNNDFYTYLMNYMRILIYINNIKAEILMNLQINSYKWGDKEVEPLAIKRIKEHLDVYEKKLYLNKEILDAYCDSLETNFKEFADVLRTMDVSK